MASIFSSSVANASASSGNQARERRRSHAPCCVSCRLSSSPNSPERWCSTARRFAPCRTPRFKRCGGKAPSRWSSRTRSDISIPRNGWARRSPKPCLPACARRPRGNACSSSCVRRACGKPSSWRGAIPTSFRAACVNARSSRSRSHLRPCSSSPTSPRRRSTRRSSFRCSKHFAACTGKETWRLLSSPMISASSPSSATASMSCAREKWWNARMSSRSSMRRSTPIRQSSSSFAQRGAASRRETGR